jgi:hypothetical protein
MFWPRGRIMLLDMVKKNNSQFLFQGPTPTVQSTHGYFTGAVTRVGFPLRRSEFNPLRTEVNLQAC